MQQGRSAIVVGMGRVGLSILQDLPPDWQITVIDVRPEALAAAPGALGGRPVRKVLGDATSRLVLADAGLALQVALVAVTGSTRVNREVAALARRDFGVEDLVCVVEDAADLAAQGLQPGDVLDRHQATAALVLNRMGLAEIRGVSLGLGKGELRQIAIREGSPALGRPLRELSAKRWLIAAVYREGRLIVPHGETVLAPGDQVLLVGEPAVLASVGAFLRGSGMVFPSQYGPNLGVLGREVAPREAEWLAAHGRVEQQILLEPGELSLAPAAVAAALGSLGVGCLVLDAEPLPLAARLGLTIAPRHRLIQAARVPALIARGRFPYRRVLVAVHDERSVNVLGGVGVDVARQCGASLAALTVLPPSLAQGEEERASQEDLPRRVAQIARLHGLEVERLAEEGNPIERIRAKAEDFDLLVAGHSPRGRSTVLNPDVSLHLLHDVPCSALFVPWNPAGR